MVKLLVWFQTKNLSVCACKDDVMKQKREGWFQFEFYFSSNFRLSSEKIFVFFFSSFSAC